MIRELKASVPVPDVSHCVFLSLFLFLLPFFFAIYLSLSVPVSLLIV